MTLPELYAIFATILFCFFAIGVLLRQEQQKQKLWQKELKTEKELESKDEFTHVIVHELRAPLTAIKDAAILLESSYESMDHAERTTLLTMITDQSKKLLNQITSLLDAAKISAGKFTLDKKKTNLANVINQEVTVFEPVAQTKRITLTTHVDPALPEIIIDPVRMGQVINNLVSNSLKFTPDGGEITVSAESTDARIIVSVSDTGSGIAKDRQNQLFSKFSQIMQNPQKRGQHIEGTGLGLYIVKGIVEAHGGSVKLESSVGEGTTVTFMLPLEEKVSINQSPKSSV